MSETLPPADDEEDEELGLRFFLFFFFFFKSRLLSELELELEGSELDDEGGLKRSADFFLALSFVSRLLPRPRDSEGPSEAGGAGGLVSSGTGTFFDGFPEAAADCSLTGGIEGPPWRTPADASFRACNSSHWDRNAAKNASSSSSAWTEGLPKSICSCRYVAVDTED